LCAALRVKSLDDTKEPLEVVQRKKLEEDEKLTIGIVGFGLFGQFLAKRMVQAGHRVLATSRSPYENEAKELGVEYFR
jgi:arogenate dehydrogenase (NADP+), plant